MLENEATITMEKYKNRTILCNWNFKGARCRSKKHVMKSHEISLTLVKILEKYTFSTSWSSVSGSTCTRIGIESYFTTHAAIFTWWAFTFIKICVKITKKSQQTMNIKCLSHIRCLSYILPTYKMLINALHFLNINIFIHHFI